jgi:hypothetical protein
MRDEAEGARDARWGLPRGDARGRRRARANHIGRGGRGKGSAGTARRSTITGDLVSNSSRREGVYELRGDAAEVLLSAILKRGGAAGRTNAAGTARSCRALLTGCDLILKA